MINTIKIISEVIALSALGLNVVISLPQTFKILKTKNSKGVSAFSFISIVILQIITVLHGYFHHDIALMIGMLLAAIVNTILVSLIFTYRPKI